MRSGMISEGWRWGRGVDGFGFCIPQGVTVVAFGWGGLRHRCDFVAMTAL